MSAACADFLAANFATAAAHVAGGASSDVASVRFPLIFLLLVP